MPYFKRIILLSSCLLLLQTSVWAAVDTTQTLSTEEVQIKSFVDQHVEDQIQLIKQLVDINTATSNHSGINHVSHLLEQELKNIGFTVWRGHTPTPTEFAPHLFAKHESTLAKAPTILLLGHMDTVYPNINPGKFERQGDALKGPGIIDMKGGDAVIVAVLKALSSTGNLNHFNFYVAYTSSEEQSGSANAVATYAELKEIAKHCDYVLEFEPAGESNEVAIGTRNYVFWKVTSTGLTGHSSKILGSELGAGAIYNLVNIANQFRTHTDFTHGISTNIGMIAGGTQVNYQVSTSSGTLLGKSNVIPSVAEMVGDLRSISDEQALAQLSIYADIVKQSLPLTHAIFTYSIENPAMLVTAGNKTLLKRYSEASVALQDGVVIGGDVIKQLTTDISYVSSLVKKGALSRLGPYGSGMHSGVNEHTSVEDIKRSTERAAVFIHRLADVP